MLSYNRERFLFPLTSTGELSLLHYTTLFLGLASVVDSIIGHSEGIRIVLGRNVVVVPSIDQEKQVPERHLPLISIWVFPHHIWICLFFYLEFSANPHPPKLMIRLLEASRVFQLENENGKHKTECDLGKKSASYNE